MEWSRFGEDDYEQAGIGHRVHRKRDRASFSIITVSIWLSLPWCCQLWTRASRFCRRCRIIEETGTLSVSHLCTFRIRCRQQGRRYLRLRQPWWKLLSFIWKRKLELSGWLFYDRFSEDRMALLGEMEGQRSCWSAPGGPIRLGFRKILALFSLELVSLWPKWPYHDHITTNWSTFSSRLTDALCRH